MDFVSHPKVSVIIPTYNRADLLPRSIGSVLSQHFQDFELIVVNDGSTDETKDVLARYNDERLKVVEFEQNRGIGAARSAGVFEARGEWVSFLDSDDLWRSEKLSYDLSILNHYPEIDLLFDNYHNIHHIEQTDLFGFDQAHSAFALLETTELKPDVFLITSGLAEALITANLIGTASIVTIRRAVFESIGNFNLALSGPEDFELFWRAALADVRFAYQTRVLVERHKNADSITSHPQLFVPSLLEVYDLCESTLARYKRSDLLALLNRARLRAYMSLIRAYALEGQRVQALQAFRQSLNYGFSAQSFFYSLVALTGPEVIAWINRVRKGRISNSFHR